MYASTPDFKRPNTCWEGRDGVSVILLPDSAAGICGRVVTHGGGSETVFDTPRYN